MNGHTASSPVSTPAQEVEVPDEALMVQICDGSREALAMLFRRYSRLVRTVAMRILRDSSEAEDLLQEVFLFVHRKGSIFDSSKASLRSWIVQMTYHRTIDRRRHLQSRHFYTHVEIDLYGFFSMMEQATGDSATWGSYAQHALTELLALWNSSGGYYWIGTDNNGVTINKTGDPTPDDVNTWSYLSTELADREQSIDWVNKTLQITSGTFKGVAFDTSDIKSGKCCTGVWFEGTAHTAAALKVRNLPGDDTLASSYLSDIEYAQTNGLNNDGLGIIAASINGLEADFDKYYAGLHVGATGWYGLAALGGNPFRF